MYQRVLFIGSKRSGLNALTKMTKLRRKAIIGCITIDDRSDSRSVFPEILKFCEQEKISIEVLAGSCDITNCIHKYKPDICFVIGWYYLISIEIIKLVKGGFIGIHNSLLPSYRGFAPVVWAMINGEKDTGFSVFSFDEGMDTGDIWFQKAISIGENDYIEDILSKIDKGIEGFFDEKYEMILDGLCDVYAQKSANISYGAKRVPEDGKINWGESAAVVYNFIRAQSRPYAGTFSYYNGKKITIWKAKKFQYSIYGKPGQIGIIDKKNECIIVVCGYNTGILLEEIEVDEQIWRATDFIKGYKNKFA